MKLLLGFILGVIVATAASLSAQDAGYWFDGQNGRQGTYYNGPGGLQWNDMQGNQGFIQTNPFDHEGFAPIQPRRSPC